MMRTANIPAQLRVYWGNRPRALRALTAGGELLIGSGPTAALRLPDPAISRLHCLFARDAKGRASVRDLNSRNGTWVNGERIATPTPLHSGDLVQCGYVTLVYFELEPDAGDWR